jgi:hypothetical protein
MQPNNKETEAEESDSTDDGSVRITDEHFRSVRCENRHLWVDSTSATTGTDQTYQSSRPKCHDTIEIQTIPTTLNQQQQTNDACWNLSASDLPRPNRYHLRSHVHCVMAAACFATACRRLQATFQAASVHCTVKQQQNQQGQRQSTAATTASASAASARIHCLTLEQIRFVVKFWKLAEQEDAVLLEVDFVGGSEMEFQVTYVPLIMKAVSIERSCAVSICHNDPSSTALHSDTTQCVLESLWRGSSLTTSSSSAGALEREDNGDFCSGGNMDSELDRLCASLHNSDRYDLRSQALYTLSLWLDPTITMPRAVATMSRILVTGSSGNGDGAESTTQARDRRQRNTAIQHAILRLAFNSGWDEKADSRRDEPAPTAITTSAHSYQALTIVARAVSTAHAEDVIRFVHAVDAALGPVDGNMDRVVDGLLARVAAARHNPHVAYWSTLILVALTRAAASSWSLFAPRRIPVLLPTIQEAVVVGACSHAALARASHQLLSELSVATVSG